MGKSSYVFAASVKFLWKKIAFDNLPGFLYNGAT